MVDYKTGSHSVYEMKYHFVWVTKYRYHILTGEIAHRVEKSYGSVV
ncbi:transposase [Bacillus cereus]